MYLFESFIKIERRPSRLYQITQYLSKYLFKRYVKVNVYQLQRQRLDALAINPIKQEEDMALRKQVLFYVFLGVMLLGIVSLGIHFPRDTTYTVLEQIAYYLIPILGLFIFVELLCYQFSLSFRYKAYRELHIYKGIHDVSLALAQSLLVYFIVVGQFVACCLLGGLLLDISRSIFLTKTGLAELLNIGNTHTLESQLAIVVPLLVLLIIGSVFGRFLQKKTLLSWQRLDALFEDGQKEKVTLSSLNHLES